MGIRYECDICGELIEDEENMVWVDTMHTYHKECQDEEDKEEETNDGNSSSI